MAISLISKKSMQDFIENPPIAGLGLYMKSHIILEGYMKHIYLIGLRREACEYSLCRKVVAESWIPLSSDAIKRGFKALGVKKSWHQIKSQNKRLRFLEELILNYTLKIRNIRFHGAEYIFQEGELLMIIEINQAFLSELDKAIQATCQGASILYGSPNDFEAKAGKIKEKEKVRKKMDNMLTRKGGKRPMEFETAKGKFLSS